MKYLVTTFVLLTLTLSCRIQETKEYLVYIFHEDWKKSSTKWNTGDYLWIVPYDTSCTEIKNAQLKPLFVTEEQRSSLDDKDFQKQGVGDLPIVLNDKSDASGYMLFKNKKQIQKYDYKYLYSNTERILEVYVVPIKAVCKDDSLGYYKKSVTRIDDTFEIWDDFWKDETINNNPYLSHDFSSFDFFVSYKKN